MKLDNFRGEGEMVLGRGDEQDGESFVRIQVFANGLGIVQTKGRRHELRQEEGEEGR